MGPANYKGQRYSLNYRYDDQVHTYNVSARDSFGYESTARYHLKYGQIEETLDTNQQPMVYTYDNFGRVKTVTGPYEVGKQAYTIRFEYHPEAEIPWALTQHLDTYRSSDPLETVLFIDGLKRVLQTKKDSTVHQGGSGQARDVMVVSGRIEYDFVGRSVKQYYPVIEALGRQGVFNSQVDEVQPTVVDYDVLDRQLSTILPDNTVTSTAYGFGTDRNGQVQFLTRVVDANGQVKESYSDINQSVTAVKEFNNGGQQVIWTSYEYDGLNQIVKVLDDHQNVTEARYDWLGRRTHLNNPDTGLTETVYDAASNVVRKITANLREKGQAVVYEYDYKRLLNVIYPQFTGNNVKYTYGAPGAAFNRAGRVVSVSDQSGTEESFYGPLGEVVKSVKTIASDTGSQPEIYTTEYQYDTWNRLQTLVYPDGEVLTNRYDSGGLLAAVSGEKAGNAYAYVNRLEYDKFDQRVFLELGNKVRTTYSYTASNRRLEGLQTGKASGRTFQNLTYQYDKVGNILGQANLATVNAPNQMGGATQFSYEYDDLYRLVGARGAFQEARQQHRYELSMQYDSVHNIVSKHQLAEWSPNAGEKWLPQKKVSYDFAYDYKGKQPHAPSHIGEQAFSYDANGNQMGWTHDQNGTRRQVVWDEENRIQSVFENGHEITFKYDAAGQRVIKRGTQGETAYVNQFFVVRNGAVATKQVYAGSSRIVSKVVKQEKAGIDKQNGNGKPKGSEKGVLEKQVYFYHPDHLGSTSYVTDAKGEVYQHIEYFPFGESWVEQVRNAQQVAFGFTGKALDAETGLYYFGARYYDARTSVWVSPDPILDKYLPTGDKEKDKKLLGMGGVFNSFNLGGYGYGHLNPVKFVDTDGNEVKVTFIISKRESTKDGIKATGRLIITDLDTNEIVTVEGFYSGGFLDNKGKKTYPIPTGEYLIIEGKKDGHTPKDGFYLLEPIDGNIGDNEHEGTGRGGFYLHKKGETGRSFGCVTAPDCNIQWDKVADILSGTKKGLFYAPPRKRDVVLHALFGSQAIGQLVDRYGTLEVIDATK